MITISYPIPANGLGTDFAQSERPITYAQSLKNYFINLNGAAERRLGMTPLVSGAIVSGQPTLTRLHEFVARDGTETLLTSTDSGDLYVLGASAWTQVLSVPGSARMLSVQVGNKLIFCNGKDRNFYTDNAGVSFQPLDAIINEGTTTSPTDTTHLSDSQITDWLTQTNVAINDVIFNETVSAYGIITNGTAGGLVNTVIGIAGTGAGVAAVDQGVGQVYRVIDTVALNIIPVGTSYDNIAFAGSGTSSTKIAVSALNFASTTIATADYVYNSTRAAVTRVQSVTANITVNSVSGQVAGDSLVFLKSAMPITDWLHVNWGRTYYLDAQEPTKVRISSKDDPRDLATFAKTLDASTYDFGSQQPQGDILLNMGTFQKYFVAGGRRYLYVFSGIDPIADTSAAVVNFSPVAVYPQGVVSRFGLANTGNDLLFISPDGLTNATVSFDSQNLVSNNLSDVIKSTVRQQIIATTNTDDIQLINYPRRKWIMMKIGPNIYNFNNSPVSGPDGELKAGTGTWSIFNGKFAQQNHYFLRRNGDLVACGPNGMVYKMDSGFTDDGDIIPAEIVTPWYRLEEPQRSIRVKDGKYIKPIFESGTGVVYTIEARAGFDSLSSDTAEIVAVGGSQVGVYTVGINPIGGTGVDTAKVPLRWRGEEMQFTLTSNSSAGPDIVTGWTLYGNQYGRR